MKMAEQGEASWHSAPIGGEETDDRLILAGLLLVGFWIRAQGLTFGFPFNYHFDENLYADTARTFSPATVHPAFGPFQLLLIGESWLLPLLRALHLSPEIAATLASPVMSFHLLARWTSALLGAVTPLPLYLLGRSVWNRGVGLLSAGLLTWSYMHVRGSHFGVPDTTVTLLVVLAALACVRIAETGAWRYYLLAGAATGLAIPIKQLTWPLLPLLFLFHLNRLNAAAGEEPVWRRLVRALFSARLIVASALALLLILATSPQILLHTRRYFAYWKLAAALGAKGGLDRLALDPGPRWWFYLTSLEWGLGDLLLLLSLAGVVLVIARRRPRAALLLMIYPVLFFAFLCRPGNFYFARYAMTAVPILLLAAAGLLAELLDRMRLAGPRRAVAGALIGLVAVAQPAVACLRFDLLLGREDTRTQAKHWIEANLPVGSRIVLESWIFGPQLATAKRPAPFSRRTYELALKGAYGLSEKANPGGVPYSGTLTVADYVNAGEQYIVSDSFSSASHLLDPREDQAKRAFYAGLARETQLLKEFSPYRGPEPTPQIFDESYAPTLHLFARDRPGPVLRIYRLPERSPATP
jgi:4-amino-4-deoxy-L-arabinose transferase-like glycosyltransferase